jgi:hypothetical protein
MAGIVTNNFRKHNAEQFYEAFSEADSSRMYFFIGRSTAWPNEASPPVPTDSVQATEYDVWKNMIAVKRIQTADRTFSVPRNDWANNTFYSDYNNASTTLSSNTFFVVTDDYRIYKCLYNNAANSSIAAANSTVEPTGTSTSTLNTSDGYKWKYMYSISTADILKFLTTGYISVATDSTVASAASNGAIDIIDVDAGGNYYLGDIGKLTSATNSSVLLINSNASSTDDVYTGSNIYTTGGTGSGQLGQIVNYVGSTRTATLSAGLSVTPDTTTTYVIGPRITVAGNGTTAATGYANVIVGGATGNVINKVVMVNVGAGYSTANVTVSANSSHGTGGTASPRISPPGGHGSNAVSELLGHNVMLNIQLTGSEGGTFPTSQDFRIFGILKDPLLTDGTAATASAYNQATTLTLTSVSGAGRYTADELLTGGTSLAVGRVLSFANTNAANTAGTLKVTNIDGTYSAAETITGGGSSITATVGSVAAGSLLPVSGKMLYVENRAAISRASDQTEDIKIVVKF